MVHNYHVYTQLSWFFLHHPVNSKTTCTSLSLILDMVTWGGNTFLPLEPVHMISHQSQLLGAFRQSSDNAIESSVNQDLGSFHAVLFKGRAWPTWKSGGSAIKQIWCWAVLIAAVSLKIDSSMLIRELQHVYYSSPLCIQKERFTVADPGISKRGGAVPAR